MSIYTRITQWTASHNPKWLALIRLGLGAALLLRGVTFLDYTSELEKLIAGSLLSKYNDLLIVFLPWVHIVGGFLLILGLFTRFSAFVQLPVLLMAMIFLHSGKTILTLEVNQPFAALMALLLIVFIIEGSGPLSLARYFRDDDDSEEEEEEATAKA